MPHEVLLLVGALQELDRTSRLGGGSLPVLPRRVVNIAQDEYDGSIFVAWPEQSYRNIRLAWNALNLYGRRFPLGENDRVAATIDAGADAVSVRTMLAAARTVDQARDQLRSDLAVSGLLPKKEPAQKASSSLAWIVGITTLGVLLAGAMILLHRTGSVARAKGELSP